MNQGRKRLSLITFLLAAALLTSCAKPYPSFENGVERQDSSVSAEAGYEGEGSASASEKGVPSGELSPAKTVPETAAPADETQALTAEGSEAESFETESTEAEEPEVSQTFNPDPHYRAPLTPEMRSRIEALPPGYDAYREPSPEALAIFRDLYYGLDETSRKQGDRVPGCIEYLIRRDLDNPAAGAAAYDDHPFPDSKMPYYLQYDQRWAYNEYCGGFFGQTGCGPTCMAMIYEGLTGKTDHRPDAMGVYAEQNGYADSRSGTTWRFMKDGAAGLGLKVQELPLHDGTMIKALSEGRPIIINVGPGVFTSIGHYLILRGFEDGAFLIFDPFSLENSRKAWTFEEFSGDIRNIWAYEA